MIRLTIFGNFSKYAVYISPGPVFQCEFNHDVYFGIKLSILGNFFVSYHYTPFFSMNSAITAIMSSGEYIFTIYDMVIIRHCFSLWIQLQWLLNHLETIFSLWSSLDIVFQYKFSCNGYYIIQRLYFHNIWYGHHQASFWFCIELWRTQNSCQHFVFRFIIFSKNGSGCKLNSEEVT